MLLLMDVFKEKEDLRFLPTSNSSASYCKLHHLHSMGYRSETNRQEGMRIYAFKSKIKSKIQARS